jgi:hypothetical protein
VAWSANMMSSASTKFEHVLRPDAGVLAEQLRDPPEQRFLLFQGAGVEHGDLDVHEIVNPGDAIGSAMAEFAASCSVMVMK